VSLLLTCSTTWLSLIAVWCLIGETHRGQQCTSILMLPYAAYGLSVLWMEVFCTFSMPSMCRHVRHQLMRNELLDLTTIIPVTAYH
jgi:hypothetical protein